MHDNPFLDPFARLLAEVAPVALARDPSADALALAWDALQASGFLDALVPEAQGGAGLLLSQVAPLLEAASAALAPLPIGQTMVARALLAEAGVASPAGPVVLAVGSGGIARRVPSALAAQHFLLDDGGQWLLLDREQVTLTPLGTRGSLAADIGWRDGGTPLPRPADLRPTIATLAAVDMAGAAAQLLENTLAYARERKQFGKAIGAYQAVQQQLAVMAEKTVQMRMAARLACDGGVPVAAALAAVAKGVASGAAAEICAIAHAVHGAIGISEEHDLWLFTHRLNEARASDGSESFWYGILGAARLARPGPDSAAFVRDLHTLS